MSQLSRPDVRAVLSDQAEDAGRPLSWGWLLRCAQHTAAFAARDAAAADAADDAADAADAAADAADDAADDYADDDAADDDDVAKQYNTHWKGEVMREGLLLVQVPGRYWAVTRVGWAVRVEGDEWELRGAATVVRTGNQRTLDDLAANGPEGNHTCSPPSVLPELLHRFSPLRVLVASEKAWARYVGPRVVRSPHAGDPGLWPDEGGAA
ncbi:MAG: hypothetical protein SFW67_35615 [Myxococcaceae bacterium]|nr:hypothetical protein [Myxococcaceae bacterium]